MSEKKWIYDIDVNRSKSVGLEFHQDTKLHLSGKEIIGDDEVEAKQNLMNHVIQVYGITLGDDEFRIKKKE